MGYLGGIGSEWQCIGYIVVSTTKAGKVNGFASGVVKSFRAAHFERRSLASNHWRVAIVRGHLR
jgi:hypothetical protein